MSADRKWTASQQTALDLRGKLLLVSAAAGSGKTSVLTERVIRRLLDRNDPVELSQLLIVTFTRAAAAELKSRVAEALGKALAEHPGEKRLSDQLLQLGSAQISTIDAFFQQAVRANFERVGFPASFRLADENEIYPVEYEVMESVIADLYRKYEPTVSDPDPAAVFRKVSENRFANCMDHIFGGSSSSDVCEKLLKFRKQFEKEPRGTALLGDLAAALRRNADLDFAATHHGRLFVEKVCALASTFRDEIAKYDVYRVTDPDHFPITSGNIAADAEACEALLAARGADWETFRNALFLFNVGKYSSSRNKAPWQEEYRDLRSDYNKKIDEIRKGLQTASAETVRADHIRTAELAEMLNEVYSAFNSRMKEEKTARACFTFNDVRNALYTLLTGPEGPAVAAELCGKYREIYIDEYQDVDEIQDRIFAVLGGDRRFMVGDIKQSIYAFRGSDPSVFADYRRSMPLSTDPSAGTSARVCVFMSENFRCDRPVVDFANTVCSFLFSACPESVGYLPSDDLVHGKTGDPEQGILPVVRVFDPGTAAKEPPVPPAETDTNDKNDKTDSADPSGDREAAWVAAEISHLLQTGRLNNGKRIRPEDIVILSRAGKEKFQPFRQALERLGVPVMAPGSENLAASPVLIDLLNLLRAVNNPYRDLPLSEFLTSETGGFTPEELNAVRAATSPDHSLYESLLCVAEDPESPLSEKARAFTAWLAHYRDLSVSQPADRFLRLLYLDPRLSDHASSPEYLTLYEQARVYQRSFWCGLYGFLDYVERLLAAEKLQAGWFGAAENSVRLMTMHASKGLEFPVVFLVRCGTAFNKSDKNGPLLYNRQGGFAATLFSEENGTGAKTPLQTALGYDIDAETVEGEIRLLYVALTRARERLYLTATPTRQTGKNIREAANVRRGDRDRILSANCFCSFVSAALHENARVHGPQVADVRHVAPDEPIVGIPFAQTPAPTSGKIPDEPQNADDARVAHFRDVLATAAATPYPLDYLRGIPTKAAASRLRPDLLDVLASDEQTAITERLREMETSEATFDGLLAAHRAPTAAEVGTATHAFLEFCDLPNLTPDGIDAEMDRLVAKQFITPETAAIANKKALRAFAASPVIARVREASRVLREQKFGLFLPLSELTTDPDRARLMASDGRELFVQGSIDLLLVRRDGSIELYDYKTDRVDPDERADRDLLLAHLKARHGNQLACYVRAVENLFGKRPDKTYLFMLSLGEAIEI